MPSALPPGDPAPADGRLPVSATADLARTPFSAYVHVPFCTTRCGYCDFNTYTADQLGGMSQGSYVKAVLQEVELARGVLRDVPKLSSVFFGGGTPTLLAADDQTSILTRLTEVFGLDVDCEITTEANPESVSLPQLERLREAGVNRISFGMQSSVPHVLETLDRVHTPRRVTEAVEDARKAGFESVSVDLIYGTPGESIGDWEESLATAVQLAPGHVSAYALIVEPGTGLARRIEHGEVLPIDDDDQADKYEVADQVLSAVGYEWYEVSNWARNASDRSQHNLSYWRGTNWWGFGPGAHSHVGGVRWWNVKHPRAYAERLSSGQSPAMAREVLDVTDRVLEQILLQVRLREGLRADTLDAAGQVAATALASDGLIDAAAWASGQIVLTLRGRLLADFVVRRLTGSTG